MSIDKSDSNIDLAAIREVIVLEYEDSPDSSPATTSEDEEVKPRLGRSDIPAEYWHIQKLVKYLKTGNQTATMVALSCIKDHDLRKEVNQRAIQDMGGLEVLINLLETNDIKCKLGALKVLCELSYNLDIRRCIADLGGAELLVRNLDSQARDLQILVAEMIHNVAKVRKVRKHVRKYDGIPKLVDLLDVSEHCLNSPMEELKPDEKEFVLIAISAARALLSLSQSHKNVEIMMKTGAVRLFSKLIKSIHIEVVIPSIGTISQCASDHNYQMAIETEGIIKHIVKHLSAEKYPKLRRYCAETIFKCGKNLNTSNQVRQAGGLEPLVVLAKNPAYRSDKALLASVTGAIWKTAISKENVERYDQLKVVNILVGLLENVEENSAVLSNVVGALAECLKFNHNIAVLRRAGGIPYLVNLLNYTYPPLLENVPKVLKVCATDTECMRIIEELDGVRLIWSLLKNPAPKVQANAAWSLVPCIRNALDSGEMCRCFVGGLGLIVNLLKSTDNRVLAGVCSAIAEVAQDRENLGIISDHGVVPLLVNLVRTEDERLQEHLACAIGYCCMWGSNNKIFGRLGVITPLVGYMSSSNINIHRTTALALYYLSKNPFNCITMHESGVVPFLLKSVASTDNKLQEASAGCLGNIRRLALEAETFDLITRGKKKDEQDDI